MMGFMKDYILLSRTEHNLSKSEIRYNLFNNKHESNNVTTETNDFTKSESSSSSTATQLDLSISKSQLNQLSRKNLIVNVQRRC